MSIYSPNRVLKYGRYTYTFHFFPIFFSPTASLNRWLVILGRDKAANCTCKLYPQILKRWLQPVLPPSLLKKKIPQESMPNSFSPWRYRFPKVCSKRDSPMHIRTLWNMITSNHCRFCINMEEKEVLYNIIQCTILLRSTKEVFFNSHLFHLILLFLNMQT